MASPGRVEPPNTWPVSTESVSVTGSDTGPAHHPGQQREDKGNGQQSEQARAPAAAGLAHIPVTVAGAAPVWRRISRHHGVVTLGSARQRCQRDLVGGRSG